MTALVRHPIRFLLLGTIAALSFGALGKFAPSDVLERDWGVTNRDFTILPVKGRLDDKLTPWSDTYTESGSPVLLSRWYQTEFEPAKRYRVRDFSTDEMKKMDRPVRSAIANEQSSANLFDLFRGRVDYPLARDVKRILNHSKNAEHLDEWLNFGWAAAATSFKEPNQVKRTVYLPSTGQPLDLEIGSTDVKAVIAYYYGVVARSKVKVYKTGALDPLTFHLLLKNLIHSGDDAKSFVVDIDPSSKIDFRPVVAYESDIRLVAGSDNLYRVTTTVEYASRRLPQKAPYGYLFNSDTDAETYEYTFSTDSSGRKIIGGAWAGDRIPDIAWRVKELPSVDLDGFSKLRDLYEEAPLE